ncbi:MAG: hypothetical protein DME10_19665 [Candidatus Rokuibacteriota bacterium]|nr:MAG: hypothetical protein DME10_19665 [Candidatus Rokubacteria bacterium]
MRRPRALPGLRARSPRPAVLLVSLIAVLRKLITLDLKTVPPATVLAVAGLVGALAGAYWLMRKSVRGAEHSGDSTRDR